MIEIPFWQSAAAGAVLAAMITALSSWFQRRRDDRIESRRTRREAGSECVRSAYRLRAANLEVVARVATSSKPEKEAAMTAWVAAWFDIGEHSVTARALAAHGVGELLEKISIAGSDWFSSQITERGYQEIESDVHRAELDKHLSHLVEVVRKDAKIDLGASFRRTKRGSSDRQTHEKKHRG